MQASEKLFLQTVGRFVAQRIAERLIPLAAQIDGLKAEVRELKSQMREVQEGGVRYCGVYQRAAEYRRGDVISYDGSMWVALRSTDPMEIPGKSACWQLSVKHGRDADTGATAA